MFSILIYLEVQGSKVHVLVLQRWGEMLGELFLGRSIIQFHVKRNDRGSRKRTSPEIRARKRTKRGFPNFSSSRFLLPCFLSLRILSPEYTSRKIHPRNFVTIRMHDATRYEKYVRVSTLDAYKGETPPRSRSDAALLGEKLPADSSYRRTREKNGAMWNYDLTLASFRNIYLLAGSSSRPLPLFN